MNCATAFSEWEAECCSVTVFECLGIMVFRLILLSKSQTDQQQQADELDDDEELSNEHFGGDVHAARELSNHGQRETTPSIQDLRDATASYAEDLREIFSGSPTLF